MKRAFVVLNPAAGRGLGRRLGQPLAEALRAAGWEAEIRPTAVAGDERGLAAEGARAGWPTVIAAGGDGTVHGVANGLLDAEPAAATLGVVAIGTGNDFAKLTGAPIKNVREAVAVLDRAEPRRFDVGRVENEYFTNGLGVGFGPAVIREMQRLPRLRGFALYLGAVFPTLFRYRPMTIPVEAESLRETAALTLAEVSIGTTAGGGFRLTPDADPEDGQFDVCVIREVGVARFLRYIPKVISGRHTALPEVTVVRATRVRLGAEGVPLLAHLDGELREYAGVVEAIVVPRRLPVLCAS